MQDLTRAQESLLGRPESDVAVVSELSAPLIPGISSPRESFGAVVVDVRRTGENRYELFHSMLCDEPGCSGGPLTTGVLLTGGPPGPAPSRGR